ncbi:hypothetical protein GOP47_0027872 [Adiantum capillus-veneris]|nr:hypothetical protein GOP47_0027872 [Adiantum capillus-veneris]
MARWWICIAGPTIASKRPERAAIETACAARHREEDCREVKRPLGGPIRGGSPIYRRAGAETGRGGGAAAEKGPHEGGHTKQEKGTHELQVRATENLRRPHGPIACKRGLIVYQGGNTAELRDCYG